MFLHYVIANGDFKIAGEASINLKRVLEKLGIDAATVRKIAIAMYEAEINSVIHAYGGTADVYIMPDKVRVILKDSGPGIPNIERAMEEGYSTATEKVRSMGFGAGMGLPNIKKHSDYFKITSEAGMGTTLEIEVNITQQSI
jgi:anti-sigma regulatory factor (Ser/Thr protein kinase)